MLAIAGEFGLSAADLIRASETIAASREETDRSSKTKQKAMQDFRLHLFCYAAAIVGLFLLNWSVSPEYWWFILATIAYGPVVAVHGFIARYNPELALSLLGEERRGPGAEGTGGSRGCGAGSRLLGRKGDGGMVERAVGHRPKRDGRRS